MHDDYVQIYIYTRVSTKKQTSDNKYGLDIQYDTCSNYLLKKHKKTIHYTDVGSSYNKKNILTERNKLLKESVNNSLIIIYNISRIGRDVIDTIKFLEKIKKKNITIYSVQDNLTFNKSKLMDNEFYHKVINSENNSDLKSVAIKKKIKDIKNKGGYVGKPPFGYYTIKINDIRYLKEDTYEQKIAKLINRKMTSFSRKYNNPYSKTAEYLNNESIFYKNKEWTKQNIKYIITLSSKYINYSMNIFSIK